MGAGMSTLGLESDFTAASGEALCKQNATLGCDEVVTHELGITVEEHVDREIRGQPRCSANTSSCKLMWTSMLLFTFLFMVGAYAAVRFRQRLADSGSHAMGGRAQLVPALPSALSAQRAPQMKVGHWASSGLGFLPSVIPVPLSRVIQRSEPRGFKEESRDDSEHRGVLGESVISDKTDHVDKHPSSAVKASLDADESPETYEPQKPQVDVRNVLGREVSVRKVLGRWRGVATAKEVECEQNGDVKCEKLMRSTLSMIDMIQADLDVGVRMQIFGVAFGKASEDNIQALAGVTTRLESDENGKLLELAKEQGFAQPSPVYDGRLPAMHINEIVATPNEKQKGAGRALLNGIIAWAKEKCLLVTIAPVNEKLEGYYQSLGFEHVDMFTSMMVYSGRQKVHEQNAATDAILLDLL